MPWERYDGHDIEAVVAIMLLRQHRHGWRVRPSQGDGGLDVVIPIGPRHWEIYQVKSFTTKLNSSQKKQIEKSWERMLAFAKDAQIRVVAWYVVRPLDASREDRTWLENLTKDSGIPSDWKGLTHLDGWAAQFPDVIDYYFESGRQRVLGTAREFVKAAGLERAAENDQIVTPDTALDGLVAISRSLNAIDPHCRYRLTAQEAPVDRPLRVPSGDAEGLMYSRVIMRDGTLAQVDVFTRYDEAVHDRPTPAKTPVTFRPTSETEQDAVERFFVHDRPLPLVQNSRTAQRGRVDASAGREPMFLTKLWLNLRRRGTKKLLESPHAMYAAVHSCFLDLNPSTHGRVLWRVDAYDNHRPLLYIASPVEPDLTHLIEQAGWPAMERSWQTVDYNALLNNLQVGQVWQFRLTANPIQSRRRDGDAASRRVGLRSNLYQEKWLADRACRFGFDLVPSRIVPGKHEITVTHSATRSFARRIVITTATYQGHLEIRDPVAIRHALTFGIGHAKAFGCGLLTLDEPTMGPLISALEDSSSRIFLPRPPVPVGQFVARRASGLSLQTPP